MEQVDVVHLVWKEYEWIEKDEKDKKSVYNSFTRNEDRGIYQIYGDHPVYGQNTLL